MGYARTLEKAWNDISGLAGKRHFSVSLLSDNYDIDLDKRTVLSSSCNVPAKDHISIILLHYLIQKSKLGSLPQISGEWIDFNELEGGSGYYPAFKKRTIARIIRKYGADPAAFLSISDRLPAKEERRGDAGMVIEALEGVPILITLEKADEEFGPDANILFDRNISKIFCTEDVVVLTEFVVHSL